MARYASHRGPGLDRPSLSPNLSQWAAMVRGLRHCGLYSVVRLGSDVLGHRRHGASRSESSESLLEGRGRGLDPSRLCPFSSHHERQAANRSATGISWPTPPSSGHVRTRLPGRQDHARQGRSPWTISARRICLAWSADLGPRATRTGCRATPDQLLASRTRSRCRGNSWSLGDHAPVADGARGITEPRQLIGQDQEPRRQLARPWLPVLPVHRQQVLARD